MNKKTQFLTAALLSFSLSVLGFTLFYFELIGLGYTFFIIVPLSIGYFLGLKPDLGLAFIISVMVGLAAFFFLLITSQLDGLICVVILLPLFIPLIFLGIWLGYVLRKKYHKNGKSDIIKISLYPLIVLLFSGGIEHFFGSKYEEGMVKSVIDLPYDAATVYDYIKSVDTLEGKKSWLMALGLSVPQKCVLEQEEPGAKRTCYFEDGTIEEKVIDIKRGEYIKMKVTDFKLPGFRWIKFDDAVYLFTQKDNITRLTRITTYRSQLKPRFYWEFWERQAIKAQHEYVLTDLRRRLDADAK